MSEYIRRLREKVGNDLVLAPGVAAIVRDTAGRVLLGRREDDGRWDLPAGMVDPGETVAQAVAREVWEETGLLVVPERIAGVFGAGPGFRNTYPNGDEVEFVDVVFECRVVGGRLGSRDGETTELRYFAPEEIPTLACGYPLEVFTAGGPQAPAAFTWSDAWLTELTRGR